MTDAKKKKVCKQQLLELAYTQYRKCTDVFEEYSGNKSLFSLSYRKQDLIIF